MLKKKVSPTADIGVIVGRFQVPFLHEGHIELINSVMRMHPRTLVVLGLSPCVGTKNNPLDFEARKQMILQAFPKVTVLYIKDCASDEVWSKKLDEQIEDFARVQSVMLYGCRDSFIKHYFGKFPTTELESTTYISGTEIRAKISKEIKATQDFRSGVIWGINNRYPVCFPTVDVAIFNDDMTKILLARKPYEEKYRFIGGFANPGSLSFEEDARREVREEANIEVSDPVYICSSIIDDWRYRNESDKIKTTLFACKYIAGKPVGSDDVAEVKWFNTTLDIEKDVVSEHRGLMKTLIEKMKQNKITL
jgi:bifunctional NMN adenylyltransferase/nudix hydrolase